MNSLKLQPLTPQWEARFWELAECDMFGHYFFVADWQLQPEKTEIYLAIDGQTIVGSMLIYSGAIAQVRGCEEAVAFLLGNLCLEHADVQVPASCQDLLLAKYPQHSVEEHVMLMTLDRGEERLRFNVEPEPLKASEALAVADLMHRSIPGLWGDITAEAIAERIAAKEAVWVGVKDGASLAAFGYGMKTGKVGHVTWVATDERYRGRGYASSVVSALLKEILSQCQSALIYVVEGNNVAQGIYAAAGFKPHSSYFFVKT